MKSQFAIGFIPYKIGDKVIIFGTEMVVDDIRMIQYIKDKTVEFEVLIQGIWCTWKLIEKRIKQEQHEYSRN